MADPLLFLLNLLEDEFRDIPDVRVRPVFPTGVKRSPDLVQDYDPEANSLHRRSGVNVVAHRKEFFFPSEWLASGARSDLDREIERVREFLSRS